MSELLINDVNGVRWLTLNRPDQRNALDRPLLDALYACVEQTAADGSIRCLVITASGKSFCAGADVAEWAAAEARGELETYGWTDKAHRLMVSLAALPIPTIAMLNGSAVGAGLDLALCCDFRFAVGSAKFKPGYTTMAYCPDAGSSWHLPRLIGEEQAKLFLFLDNAWNAKRALTAGMITGLETAESLKETVTALANRLAQGPTVAFKQTKALLEKSRHSTLAQQLSYECEAGLACGRSEDAQEALRAATEKRSPNFVGR